MFGRKLLKSRLLILAESTSLGLGIPVMATDLFFLFPSGVAKNMLTPIQGQHTNVLERAASNDTTQRRCSDRSDQSGIPVRPVVAGQAGGETNERRLGRTRRGRRTQGCYRVGRPPRMPSIDVETKEEQQIIDGKKARAKRK